GACRAAGGQSPNGPLCGSELVSSRRRAEMPRRDPFWETELASSRRRAEMPRRDPLGGSGSAAAGVEARSRRDPSGEMNLLRASERLPPLLEGGDQLVVAIGEGLDALVL